MTSSGGHMGGGFSSSSSSSPSDNSYPSAYDRWPSHPSYTRLSTVPETSNSCNMVQEPYRPQTLWQKRMSGLVKTVSVIGVITAIASIVWVGTDSGSQIIVHKNQVCLLGITRTLQKDLDRIAGTADSSTSKGLQYILTETALALFRHPDYWFSAYSSVYKSRSREDAEKEFNRLSFEERAKFDEVTLLNLNNITMRETSSKKPKGLYSEYIVVTILLADDGTQNLPVITGSADLEEALQKLGSLTSNQIVAVEVLWTPQKADDILSESELHEKYPLLKPL